jgi:hypothetical protein
LATEVSAIVVLAIEVLAIEVSAIVVLAIVVLLTEVLVMIGPGITVVVLPKLGLMTAVWTSVELGMTREAFGSLF